MKTIVIFITALMLLLMGSSALSQSQFRTGDKTPRETRRLVRTLNKERKALEKRVILKDHQGDTIALKQYRRQINLLTEAAINLLVETATEKQEYLVARGKATEVNESFALAKFYQNQEVAKPFSEDTLKGLLVNLWFRKVAVTVKGPGGWQYTTWLEPNGTEMFRVPYPGTYWVTFIWGSARSSVIKKVNPLKEYQYEGTKYSLVSVLLR